MLCFLPLYRELEPGVQKEISPGVQKKSLIFIVNPAKGLDGTSHSVYSEY